MNVGGAETMVKDYALLMDKEKIDMKIVALSGRYDSTNEVILQEAGIPIIFLEEAKYGGRKDLNFFQKIIRKIYRYYYFRKLILEEKPDILHIHLRFDKYIKVLPLKKLNLKLVHTVHNEPTRFFDKNGKDRDKYKEFKEAYRLVHEHNMKLIALHDSMKEELKELFETTDVVTVNNGIQMEQFQSDLYDRESTRKELDVASDEFLIGHVGRYHIQKNHERIITVFRELLKKQPRAKLLLIGRGALKENIIARVKEWGIDSKVIFLENRIDVPALMNAMDVFFFPSRWEGFGNVLTEAQSIGLRCVISTAVPKDVQLTDKVIPVDLEETDDVWVDALLDKDRKGQAIGCLDDYDMKKCAKKLQDIYLGML